MSGTTPHGVAFQIDLTRLQTAIDCLFHHIIITRGIKSVNLDIDAYWDIDTERLYDIAREPNEFDVDSLTDDWDFASKLLDSDWQPLANQLCEIAPILRRLGEVLGRDLAQHGG